MNVNRSAEYIALWKSRQRAEWEAVRLDHQASARCAARVPAGHEREATSQSGEASDGISRHRQTAADQLQQESQRMWQLCAELDSELEQVAAALTPRQRKSAEKVLKQWEREEKERLQQGG